MKLASTIALILLSVGCNSSRYGVIATEPVLSVSVQEGPYYSETPFYADITVQQQGVNEGHSLSIAQVIGSAEVELDGSEVPVSGEWIRLAGNKVRMSITPLTTGTLTMSLQVQSPEGAVSKKQNLECMIEPSTGIKAELEYDSRHINMAPEILIPIRLKIEKPGYDGKYTVTPSIDKGEGIFYHDHYVVNDIPFEAEASTEILYRPAVIGEHIFDFKIEAGKFSTTARAYIDVIRKISVVCPVEGGFSISGIGEYNTEGKDILLKLQNEDLYNFEVAGWYEQTSGKRLSTEPTYTLKLATDCITDISLLLKLRTVQITMKNPVSEEIQYLIQENGKPVVKTVYDCSTQFLADFKVSDPIKFFYEEYRYDQSTLPPTARKKNVAPAFSQGATRSGYLYRIDSKFKVYLRKSDNPGFIFNTYNRSIESPSTKYSIPSNITMQN